jgi:hypothetical protein
MFAHRARLGFGIVAVGVVLALVPVVSASAGQYKSKSHHHSGGLCSAAKNELSASSKTTNALTQAMESGNWSEIQKDLLASFNSEGSEEQAMINYLSSAPGNVKSAAQTVLKFVASLKKIIQNSTSMTQFDTSMESAEQNPKLESAEKVLDAYSATKCPGLTPSTSTPTT